MLVQAGLRVGLIVWAAATALLIPFGRYVFGPENRLPVALSAGMIDLATFIGIYWFAQRILRRTQITTLESGALLGACACLPGLVLDGALYAFNGGRYPGLDAAASGVMSSALLLAYAAALLATLAAAKVSRR